MADILHDPELASQDLRAHEKTFHSFGKLVLFAILHIMLVLSCLALAFLGNAPLIALIAGVGGTVLLLALFATVV
jgi:Bacterial aa3 type cytochrome c oxidase subunit IV